MITSYIICLIIVLLAMTTSDKIQNRDKSFWKFLIKNTKELIIVLFVAAIILGTFCGITYLTISVLELP